MSAAATTSDQVLIRRVFQAPRERVFAAFTDRRVLEQWFAPHGCTIEFKHLDFRVGRTFHSCIRTPDGYQCWCRGEYQEIKSPEKIVHTMENCNAAGEIIHPADIGMDPAWPPSTLVTLTFEEIDGRTHFTLHQTVSEALAKKTGAHPSWLQMLDRLAERVEK